jgi:hypothetical protein
MRQVVFCIDWLKDGVGCRNFDTTFISVVLVDYFLSVCDLLGFWLRDLML